MGNKKNRQEASKGKAKWGADELLKKLLGSAQQGESKKRGVIDRSK